jgi:DnaK suppressor protein
MAKSTKKRVPAKKQATRKVKAVRKPSPKKSKKTTRETARSKISKSPHKLLERLLQLRDAMVDSMAGVAQDTLRSRAEGSEASAFGMHQADAGSDAYDRDFALSLLSQEQDALYEIDQALKRIEVGTYGVCEMSGKQIPRARLEAIPFARFTVECQSQLEKQSKASRVRQSVTSLFGLTEEEGGEGEGEEEPAPVENTKE